MTDLLDRGALPGHWSVSPLRYVASINDHQLTDDTPPETPIRYMDVGSVNGDGSQQPPAEMLFENAPSRARRLVSAGDTVVSTVRTYLRAITFVGDEVSDCVWSTGFAIVSPNDEVDPRFLYYVARSNWFVGEVQRRSVGVSYPAVNASDIAGIPIPIPPLDEQRHIADFLDAQVGRMANLTSSTERLSRLLEERYRSEVSTVLDNAATGTTQLKFVLAQRLKYGANEAAESDPAAPRFIRITDIRADGTLRPDTYRSLSAGVARPYLLSSGDLLFARSGATVGKAFLYDADHHDSPACFAGYLIRARVDRARALARFAYYWTQTHRYWDEVGLALTQATIPNVNAERYGNLPFPLASLEAQEEAVRRLDASAQAVSAVRHAINNQLELTEERRQALITAAVTGQIDPATYGGAVAA